VPDEALSRDTQPQARHSLEQRGKGNVAFQAGQRRTQTGMDAMSKAKMSSELAGNIQLVWLRKLCLIVIRREQCDNDYISFFDPLPGNLDIFGSEAWSRCSGRPIEAQQFFNRRRYQAQVRFEFFQLFRCRSGSRLSHAPRRSAA
jgi:hypothetical protein